MGIYKEYFDNRQIMIEVNYINGKMNGIYKKIYKTIYIERIKCWNYIDNKKEGKVYILLS